MLRSALRSASSISRRGCQRAYASACRRARVSAPAVAGPKPFVAARALRLMPSSSQWLSSGSNSFYASQRARMSAAAATFDTISAAEGAESVNSGTRYLDVRTPEEWEAGHVPGSVNIPILLKSGGAMVPNPAFMEQVQSQLPDKDEEFVVGCKSGKRSEMAAQAMSQAGYTRLHNMAGGFDAWAASNFPVTKPYTFELSSTSMQPSRYESIDVEEAREKVERKGYAFLDVRTPEEFQEGHPPGAVNVPVAVMTPDGRQPNPNFLQQVCQQFPDKSAAICVACGGGTRGTSAAERLVEEGYEQVVCMPGGWKAWKARGLPVTTE